MAFTLLDDSTKSLPIKRRHSIDHPATQSISPDTASKAGDTNGFKAYDENSSRAKELQTLLRDGRGLDDPTWNSELAISVSDLMQLTL